MSAEDWKGVLERDMALTHWCTDAGMPPKRCLRFLLAAALVATSTPVSFGETPRPSAIRVEASSPRQRIYPLQFNPGAYDVWSFATMRDGQPAIFANNRDQPELLFDEFLSGRQIRDSELDDAASLRIGAVVDAPSTLNRIGLYGSQPPQKITSRDLSITLITNNPQRYVPEGLFYDSCLDPAASYMQIRRGNVVEDKVLLYVFAKPVHPIAFNRCEEDIFSPPNNMIRIIDPVLVARVEKNGDWLLAGASYLSMPIVISVPAGRMVTGDGASLFVVNKSVVDDCYLSAITDFDDKVNAGTVSEHQGAVLAALIETCLLDAVANRASR